MERFKNILIKVIKIILLLLIASLLMGVIYHNIYIPNKIGKIENVGEFIEIDGKNLHVYARGRGERTIVLLSGHGVALPYVDFGPLIRELEDDYKVVVVEYFGTGISDITNNKRENEDMVREIRDGLKGVGIEGPYILMPHSISSVYSEYYAKTYPDEIEGIFILDGTVPTLDKIKDIDENIETINKTFKTMGIIQKLGIQDIVYSGISEGISADSPLPYTIENGYTKEELENLELFLGRNINSNMIDQLGSLKVNILELTTMSPELDIPVFKVISSESKEEKAAIEHLKSLNINNSYEILEGDHFIYRGNEGKIKELLNDFIVDISNE